MQAGMGISALKVLRKQVKKSLNGCFHGLMGEKVSLFSKKRRYGTGCGCEDRKFNICRVVSNNQVTAITATIAAQSNAAFIVIDKTVISERSGTEDAQVRVRYLTR